MGPWLVLVMIGTGLLEIAIGTSRILAAAALWLLAARRGVVSALIAAAVLGVCAALIGPALGMPRQHLRDRADLHAVAALAVASGAGHDQVGAFGGLDEGPRRGSR